MAMSKNHLLKPTLFFVLSVILLLYVLFEIISSGEVEGWAYRMTKLLLPVALFMLVSDVLLKFFLSSVRRIWIIEGILSLGVIYYWIVS